MRVHGWSSTWAWGAALALALGACGGGPAREDHGAAGGDGGAGAAVSLLPLRVGARWTFQVTDRDTGAIGSKAQEVTGETRLAGVEGVVFVVVTDTADGARTESLQQDVGDAVVRFDERRFSGGTLDGRELYSPSKLRVPEALLEVGDRRTDHYDEQTFDGAGRELSRLSKTEDWVVEAIEPVATPAGTFPRALRMRRTSRTGGSDKRFWFVDGVGKVREEGAGQTELLTGYAIP